MEILAVMQTIMVAEVGAPVLLVHQDHLQGQVVLEEIILLPDLL
jgi:hypothetical protein